VAGMAGAPGGFYPADRIEPLAVTEEPQLPYIWTVYPSISSLGMVAVGCSRSEAWARELVENVLAVDQRGLLGVVSGPGGKYDICRRNVDGGFAWTPSQ
jgi:hypothetical protein